MAMSPSDEATFRSLHSVTFDAVARYRLRRLPADIAHDAVADVYLVAWRRIDDAPASDEALAWLYVNRPDWVDDVEYVDPDYGHTSFGQLNTLPEAFLILNRHNAEILTTHLDAYRADLEATGGLPDEWSPDRWGVPAEG